MVLNGVIELAASAIEKIPFIGDNVGDAIRSGKMNLSTDVTQEDIDAAMYAFYKGCELWTEAFSQT